MNITRIAASAALIVALTAGCAGEKVTSTLIVNASIVDGTGSPARPGAVRIDGDRIDLTQVDAIAGNDGDDAFTFVGNADFSNKAGELRYEVVEGLTHVFGDTDGDGQADFGFIVNTDTIRTDDFLL